jgi:hypothetical protein
MRILADDRIVVVERRSRRLRLCPECNAQEGETDGKCRDRDVQGARNILWIQQHVYYGDEPNRPWYMTLKGRRRMEEDGILNVSRQDAGYTPPVHAPDGEHPREYAH